MNIRKYVSVTEDEGKAILGVDSVSKKEARKSCVLRLLDTLIVEQRFSGINMKGRKIREKVKPSTFADDLDFEAVCLIFNVLLYHSTKE